MTPGNAMDMSTDIECHDRCLKCLVLHRDYSDSINAWNAVRKALAHAIAIEKERHLAGLRQTLRLTEATAQGSLIELEVHAVSHRPTQF